jgi:plastocyanin
LVLAALLSSSTVKAKITDKTTNATIPTTTFVSIIDFQFQPEVVTITAGSTVSWMNAGGSVHTTTSDTGVWDSGDLNPSDVFTWTFDAPGIYAYHCERHPTLMKGEVVVLTYIYLPVVFKNS